MRREGLWLWALAALVLLAIVIVLGVRACDDDKGTSSTGTPIVTESFQHGADDHAEPHRVGPRDHSGRARAGSSDVAAGQWRRNALVGGDQDLYPALAGSLTKFANQQATGKELNVVSVVSDQAFWAGRGKAQRLLVVINPKGETPPKVRAGQKVSFSGQVLANEGDYGVTVPVETALLARHGHHVLVSAQDLKLR